MYTPNLYIFFKFQNYPYVKLSVFLIKILYIITCFLYLKNIEKMGDHSRSASSFSSHIRHVLLPSSKFLLRSSAVVFVPLCFFFLALFVALLPAFLFSLLCSVFLCVVAALGLVSFGLLGP